MSETTPPRYKPRLKSTPRIRQLYWCDFPNDAHLPELWKRRPVIILSKTATLHGSVVVIPCSTDANQEPKLTHALQTSIDGRVSFAICDKPTTVAVSRLSSPEGHIPRLSEDDFHAVLAKVLSLLPVLPK